ncbi:MAG: hypothetical protein Q9157_001420 [Trypethelium eluteriae]
MYSQVFKFALLALSCAGISPSLAAPTVNKRTVAPNTQSCYVTNHVLSQSFDIDIGVTYANGTGCDNVYHALQDASGLILNWRCIDDGNGNTQLYFDGPDADGILVVNRVLSQEYPAVSGFNCSTF